MVRLGADKLATVTVSSRKLFWEALARGDQRVVFNTIWRINLPQVVGRPFSFLLEEGQTSKISSECLGPSWLSAVYEF